MLCEACGAQLQPAQQYCSTCGKLVSPDPFAVARLSHGNRVRQHIHVLGIFWVVLSGLHLFGGIVLFATAIAYLSTVMQHDAPLTAMQFVRPFITIVALLILGKGLLGLAAGLGLLRRARWARSLTLTLGFLSLFEFPFGTVLGIYTIWVLLSSNADQEYRSLTASG
jgi:hypothetical protein